MHHFLIVFLQVLLRLVNGVLAMLIGAKTLTHLVRPVCSTAVATADAITKKGQGDQTKGEARTEEG